MTYARYYWLIILKVFANCILKEVFAEVAQVYLSKITSVDVQAAFLREKPHTDHIAKLRSVSTKRAPGLPQKLPAKETADLLDDPMATAV